LTKLVGVIRDGIDGHVESSVLGSELRYPGNGSVGFEGLADEREVRSLADLDVTWLVGFPSDLV
jgi:hypothetical protein